MSILLIGSIPPPIGGVTIHVSRLLQSLEIQNSIKHEFLDLKTNSKYKLISSILKSKIVHLHTSNSYLRFIIVLFCKITFKKCIFTFHGNVSRYNKFRNLIDLCSIKIANYPIVINNHSYEIALKHNKKALLISAFIPPLTIEELNINVISEIEKLQKSYPITFCTNAYNVSYDKKGQEIYQISNLVSLFLKNKHLLIISDPSGNYLKKLRADGIKIPQNVYVIDYPHDFNAILLKSNCFIRYTTTDGDSLSLKEALLLNKSVIASDVVDRPKGVILSKLDLVQLNDIVENFQPGKINHTIENGFEKILKLYKELMHETNHTRP